MPLRLRVLTWNLFHGRDAPPERELLTWRSRLLGRTERGPAHAQVNRDLQAEFTALLSGADWDVALLQECPPRWADELAVACDASAHLALTSRNLPPPAAAAQGWLARRNPDLIASWEGGSNLTLIRIGEGQIAARRAVILTQRPERRVLALTRLRSGLCIGNLHASTADPRARSDVRASARALDDCAQRTSGTGTEGPGAASSRHAADGAGSPTTPVILGGDFNLRPETAGDAFARLEREHRLAAPTGPRSLDHLLARGLEVLRPPEPWPAERREVPEPDPPRGAPALPIRLSDHAPVEATFHLPGLGDDDVP